MVSPADAWRAQLQPPAKVSAMHNAAPAPLGPLDFRPLTYAAAELLTGKRFSKERCNSLLGYTIRVAIMNLDCEPTTLETLVGRCETTADDVALAVAMLRELDILAPAADGMPDSYSISSNFLGVARGIGDRQPSPSN